MVEFGGLRWFKADIWLYATLQNQDFEVANELVTLPNQDLEPCACLRNLFKPTINLGDMTDFTIKECKEKGGFSVKPLKNIKLNLKKVVDSFETLLNTPILVVIQEQGEVVVRDYGELLFKELKDESKIREIATKIYGVAL